jgi:PIN domain nuclease of toxin-antitoxin system|tara:strand:+ start:2868 stop:3098 length:231 start_codon:yes stop_codon:yes gene_type:complete
LRSDVDAGQYTNDLSLTLSLTVLPISAEIAGLSQTDFSHHKDPADRLIAATAICHNAPLISSDGKLSNIKRLNVIQ